MLKRGYSIHISGPYYVQSWPDSGRITYAKDHGTGVHEVEPSQVPLHHRERVSSELRRATGERLQDGQ